jgi:hypothetical protein
MRVNGNRRQSKNWGEMTPHLENIDARSLMKIGGIAVTIWQTSGYKNNNNTDYAYEE